MNIRRRKALKDKILCDTNVISINRKNPVVFPMDILEYIASTASELASLALRADNAFLAYLLGTVAQQAADEYLSVRPQLVFEPSTVS
jgi:hypothetical protein